MSANYSQEFEKKTVVITGGSQGIGRATAYAFAGEGARVAVLDVRDKEAEETINTIRGMGEEAMYLRCDVSQSAEVKDAMEKVQAKFGSIDFAFNNAGIEGVTNPTADCSESCWDLVLDVNLKGVWLCMKYEIPYMLKQGKGAIVNCSSVAGLVGFAGLAPYEASKHGLVGLTKTAALDYIKNNIRVNAVCPGVIDTPMIDRFTSNNPEMEKQLASSEPMGRLGRPEEIANAVMWLCSDSSSFVTGVALPVDGGWVAP